MKKYHFKISSFSIAVLFSIALLVPAQDKKEKDKEKKVPEPFAVKKLTQGMGLYALGSLSPDKKSLCLVAAKPGQTPNLYVIDVADFSIRPPLTALKWGVSDPSWSPDGKMIAFAGANETSTFPDIYTYDLKTSGLRRLTANNFTDKEPMFTPDGKHILFTTDKSPLEEAAFGILHIESIPVTGGKAEYFTDDEASSVRPQLALDGKSVLLVKISEQSGRHSLWQYDLNGKPIKDLTEDRFARIHRVILHAEKNIAVLWAQRSAEEQDNVYIMNLASGEIRDLPEVDLPKRTPTLSPDGNRIVFLASASTGNHLYLYDMTTGLIQQLTSKGTSDYTPVFISNDQILFGADRDAVKKEVVVQQQKKSPNSNVQYIQDVVEGDREIYLINLTQKAEEEKKKK